MDVARWRTITRQLDLIVSHWGNPSEHDTASGLETVAGDTPPYNFGGGNPPAEDIEIARDEEVRTDGVEGAAGSSGPQR